MAVQLINIGNIANDGTGDDLREAFIKANANFEELDLRDDEQTTVSNLGSTGEGLFAQKLVYDLQFKKIVGGAGLTLTATDDNITIANDKVYDLTQTAVSGDSYVTKQYDFADSRLLYNNVYDTLADLPSPSTYHGLFAHVHTTGGAYYSHGGIWTELAHRSYVGAPTSPLAHDTSPQLGGDLDGLAHNLLNVGTISSSGITGPLTGNVTGNLVGDVTGLVHGVDVRSFLSTDTADFGDINPTVTNILEYIIYNTDIEWGSFVTPNGATLDLGAIAV
jgi:hypothetical protein|tara:strand:+ start:430 stop:1260 length:831 start_codon:yes stop_codon:yes gene_type:complete